MNAEQHFGQACLRFRERRFGEAMTECEAGLSLSGIPAELHAELLLLLCDVLQTNEPINWERILLSARAAKKIAARLPDPARSLREAQAWNRAGVAIRACAARDHHLPFKTRIAQLDTAFNAHEQSLEVLADINANSGQLDSRELHSVIVSAYNNRASALVEKAHLNRDRDPGEVKRLLEEALHQFSVCRHACNGLVPEARVATLNDEAEVLLRLSRACEDDPDLGAIALYRGHYLAGQALELLDDISDRLQRVAWEWVLREKIHWSMENDLECSTPLARQLRKDSFSDNSARLLELARLERAMYQIATVDVYYTPWSPSLAGGRSGAGTAKARLERALERLRVAFSDRHRMNSILLRNGWHGLHLEDVMTALDAAIELGEAATVCEIIETCRAQGYSNGPRQSPRPAGDTLDSLPNRALAAIGVATLGSPPDLAVRNASVLHQFAEQTIDVDLVRQSAAGADAWWWSILRAGSALYWALLTPDSAYCGTSDMSADEETLPVPSPVTEELARRREGGHAPLPLIISPSGGLGSVRWVVLPVFGEAGGHLVRHADIRIAPPVPLLDACLHRPGRAGPWPVTLLIAADPEGNLTAQATLPTRLAELMHTACVVLQSRSPGEVRHPTRNALRAALDELQALQFGGTMVYSGHGVSDGRDPVEDFGLELDYPDKLTARDLIEWASHSKAPVLPARVILAACQTIGVSRRTHEWTSVAPAALLAGAEIVVATCRDLVSDDTNLRATAELCTALCASEHPVSELNRLQRNKLTEQEQAPAHPALSYTAVIGKGEYRRDEHSGAS
jgi:hypothetical protein